MELLMRAKRFIAQKSSRLAVVAVPLAALATVAIPAHANSVVFSAGTCTATVPAFESGSCSDTSSMGGNPQVTTSGSGYAHGSAGGTIQFAASGGSNGGTLDPGVIPVAWNFFLTSSGSGFLVDWTVNFAVDLQGGSSPNITVSGSALVNSDVSGSSAIDIPAGGTPLDWTATLTTSAHKSYDVAGSQILQLDSPEAATVPEPAGVFLLPAGALLLLRRKKSI